MTPPSLPVIVPLRSKQGCWTCRLRKKKCDETRPLCSTCSSLSITCYGYGPRPAWMDDPEQERRVVAGFKDIVRHTSRHKPGRPMAAKTTTTTNGLKSGPEVNGHTNGRRSLAPQGMKSTSSLNGGGHFLRDEALSASQPSHEDGYEEEELLLPLPPPLADSSTGTSTSSPRDPSIHMHISMQPEDSTLLMHFLDHVFPLQYPLYRPDTTEGGRGWLLSTLLRITPFYHAALATSLYHHRRRCVMVSGKGERKGMGNRNGNPTASARAKAKAKAKALVEQERHLQVAIRLVTERASNACPAVGLDIMVTVVQLVFFEIFAGDGDGNGWESHLRAVMSMYDRGITHDMKPFQLGEESRTILKEDLPLVLDHESSPLVAEEVTSFRFLTATIVWLDIIASITKGTAPFLLSHHSRVLDRDSQVVLEGVMGCRNRVMLLIGRVAALAEQWHRQRTQPAEEETFECGPLRQVVYEIDGEIQCELAQLAMGDAPLSETGADADTDSGTVPVQLVTRLFASTASIHLHLVTQGFSSSSMNNLDTSIRSQAMTLLRTRTPSHLLPALVCPLFIIGLVASTEDDEQYFRDVFSAPPLCDSVYRDRARILPILEGVWSKRRVVPRFGWKEFLDVAGGILLL